MQGGDAVEDIKQKLSIEEVIGEYVELKRAGRNLKALSPFGNEKTASFMVSPEKQIWHDFSSGMGGNMFSFVMEIEGVDFRGALEILARKAGIDLSNYQNANQSNSKLKTKLSEALNLATKYYQQALVKSPEALDYLIKKRGFTRQTIIDFRLGYSPNNSFGVVKALKNRGFTDEELKKAGLGTQRYVGFSDMFRGRIMIPLCDPQGNVIGFTARLLRDEPNSPKYINTPQTLLYDKGRHVFGLSEAKQAIRSAGYVVMVEGNLDVVSSHQATVKQVIATAGTALTEYHLKTLSRFTEDIRIAFDQDEAGLRATERAIGLASRAGIKLGVIDVPEGKDPDELVQKSPELWQKIVTEPVYAIEWLRHRYKKMFDIKTAPGKKSYLDAMFAILNQLKDPVEKEHYLNILAQDLDVSQEAMLSRLDLFNTATPTKKRTGKVAANVIQDQNGYQDQLLSLLVTHPITRRVLETIDEEPVFAKEERQKLFDYIALNPHESFEEIPKNLHNLTDYVKILTLMAEELYSAFDANERLREAQDLVRRLQKDYKKSEMLKITAAVRDAEARGDSESVASLLSQFNELIGQTKE